MKKRLICVQDSMLSGGRGLDVLKNWVHANPGKLDYEVKTSESRP